MRGDGRGGGGHRSDHLRVPPGQAVARGPGGALYARGPGAAGALRREQRGGRRARRAALVRSQGAAAAAGGRPKRWGLPRAGGPRMPGCGAAALAPSRPLSCVRPPPRPALARHAAPPSAPAPRTTRRCARRRHRRRAQGVLCAAERANGGSILVVQSFCGSCGSDSLSHGGPIAGAPQTGLGPWSCSTRWSRLSLSALLRVRGRPVLASGAARPCTPQMRPDRVQTRRSTDVSLGPRSS